MGYPDERDANGGLSAAGANGTDVALDRQTSTRRTEGDRHSPDRGAPPNPFGGWADDLVALQNAWMAKQAEFWRGMLSLPEARTHVDAPGEQREGIQPDAARPASPPPNPVVGDSPVLDYLNQAHEINSEYLKRMVDAAPMADGKARESMRVLARDVVDATAPSNFLPVADPVRESRYHEIRDELRSGDIIVASKGNLKSFNNFLSLLIRIFTASSYSHVGVVIKLGSRCFVVEATPPVVRLYPLSKLDSFYVIKMQAEWTKDDENRLFDYIGKPYSDWNSISSYLTGKPLDNGKLQCAQLVSSFYKWPNLLRPEHIVKYAQEQLGKQMVFVR